MSSVFDAIGERAMNAARLKERRAKLPVPSKSQIEPVMTKQDAIGKLQSLQRNCEGFNVHANADTILCDFLDAAGYGEIVREFRKIHEMYPMVTPRYSKPSWRL